MNKRARTRLIGVTAIILLAVVALLASGVFGANTAYSKTVPEVAEDKELVGKRVKVSGLVVSGSWDQKQSPMTFTISDEEDKDAAGPTIRVVYNGAVPATFGDGVTAIVTGELDDSGTVTASEMITKCPSKYESATGAMPIADLVGAGESMYNKPTKVTGYVKAGTIVPPGGESRFIVTNDAGGGDEVPVKWEGALPSGMVDGVKVVMTGEIDESGLFTAVNVALEKK